MSLNVGYIATGCMGVEIRVYYDINWQIDNPDANPGLAPLVNGPRGYCLDITNTTGRKASFTITPPSGNTLSVSVQQGDPVATGPTSGRSRTAAQMAQLGCAVRDDVTGFDLSCS